MSPLADRLKQRQAEYGIRFAASSRAELLIHLHNSLAEAHEKQGNPAARVEYVKQLLSDDAHAALVLGLDPRALHVVIAKCILEGINLPHECMFELARGVVEPQTLKRKKGKTHELLHHEIWRLCRVLKEYRQIPLTSGESKPTQPEKGDTACGLLAEAAKGIRTGSGLSEDHIRQVYYERNKLYGEIESSNFLP